MTLPIRVSLSVLLCFAAGVSAQGTAHPVEDPANLMGERVGAPSAADTLAIDHGAPALQQLLLKLRTRASLMLIVAHPDDEDGGLLTYFSRGQGARVAMLTLTRGEGGQNLMSADFDDALGLIRTQELLAAGRYFGADQMFGTEVDFGFSKTKEETLAKWTHDRVLYDAVRAVRLYRPLVLASVFVGGPTDGHGQHQVAGEIAQEVFVAAADPKMFPEMALPAWAPLKVYARVPFSRVTAEGMFDYATGKTIPTRFHNYVTGVDTNSVPTATVQVREGDKPADPTLLAAMKGDTYVQFAREGLALQKTQIGTGVRLAPAGAFDAPYTLMGSRVGKAGGTERSMFEGIDVSLAGLAELLPGRLEVRQTLVAMDARLAEAQKMFDPAHMELTAGPLRAALSALDVLIASVEKFHDVPEAGRTNLLHELRVKRVQMNNAMLLALGLTFQPRLAAVQAGFADPSQLVANEAFKVEPNLAGTRLAVQFAVTSVSLEAAPGLLASGLVRATNLTLSQTVAAAPAVTRPYFSRRSIEQPFYDVSDPNLRNAPATPAPLVEALRISYQGVPLEMRAAVLPPAAAGSAGAAQLAAVPAVSIELTPTVGIVPLSRASTERIPLTAIVRASVPSASGTLSLKLPQGWKAESANVPPVPGQATNAKRVSFTVIPSGRLTTDVPYGVGAMANAGTASFTESYRAVGYAGLPLTNMYAPAVFRATVVDVTTAPNLRVAYLPGTGDAVAEFMANLGVTPTMITAADLTAAKLKGFDAVVLGVRAYAAHPELAGAGSKGLADYARGGGVVVVQYNSGAGAGAAAPFAYSLPGDSGHNVVDESAPVTLLEPGNALLNWPNKIARADFEGWVEERGHGFADTWAAEYKPLLEVHDPEQDPQRGGLLLAQVGKGAYVYCALALYRQLPEAVPGAYRLLANLVSYGKNPQR